MNRIIASAAIVLSLALGACAPGAIKKEASYPTRPENTDKILYSDQKRDTIWGEGTTLDISVVGERLILHEVKPNDSEKVG